MLDDQLQMQMNLFLDDSIYVDLCEDVLYLPGFLIENYSLFIKSDHETCNRKTDLENFIRFLINNVGSELKEKLKGLLELEPEIGFEGENIDLLGRRELSFPVEKISKSTKFSLVIDYNNNSVSGGVSSGEGSSCSWYKTEIQKIIKFNEEEKERKLRSRGVKMIRSVSTSTADTSPPVDSSSSSNLNNDTENFIKMDNLNQNLFTKQKLNIDCLDYINKSSPLISNSLSFLFDLNKREEFFNILSKNDDNNSATTSNSLNRFIQLYVPLEYMNHLSMQTKLNLITQFLLTNKTEESKIELIIDLANHYALKQEWHLVLSLLNNCTQDNEELNDLNETKNYKNSISKQSGTGTVINDFDLYDSDKQQQQQQQQQQDQSINNNATIDDNDGRYSRKDLYNLYDHSCICQAYQEAKTNEKSYIHLYKMKNFIKQIRAIFGLMHLWSVESCLELVDYCLTKSKMFHEPDFDTIEKSSTDQNQDLTVCDHDFIENLLPILIEKKNELTAYQELTKYARITLHKYYEHQEMQDAAGYYDEINNESQKLNKMKKCCQKCLTWQFAKNQLETERNDEETNELIMDLFLMNDHFTSAKYLIKKLNLNDKLKFKLDFGHLKYRLLNLNVASSIIVIDLDAILLECITFRTNDTMINDYMFEICFKLLNELKDLKELNNQVLISLSEYLLDNYRHKLLTEQQTKELKTLQLTAKIFQILVQELRDASFDSFKRHHSNPLLIIEQLLMNSHIDLCSRAIRLCRDSNSVNDILLNKNINLILVQYAKKALEFTQNSKQNNEQTNSTTTTSSSISIDIKMHRKKNSNNINIPLSSSSPNNSNLINHMKNNNNNRNNDLAMLSTTVGGSFSSRNSSFVMPSVPPPKQEWTRDEDVDECMVCLTRKFSLINRRHHCRRCGRVVCSLCAKNVTLIENLPVRTCDDCFKQTNELLKLKQQQQQQQQQPIDQMWQKRFVNKPNDVIRKKSFSSESDQSDQFSNALNSDNDDENLRKIHVWQLMGNNENETSKIRDDEIRSSFRFKQAPSTSLCLSILDLHDQPLECVKDLLNMCDSLSSFLHSANQVIFL
jgi:hypothetical protein